MSLSLVKYPPLVALAKNPTVFEFSSNNYITVAGVASSLQLVFGAGLVNNETFDLCYNGKILTFVVKTTPNTSGLQIKAIAAEAVNAWVVQTAAYLRQNYDLSTDFLITSNLNGITLLARETGTDYTLTLDNEPANLTGANAVAGTDQAVQAFFNIVAQTWMKRGADMVNIFEDALTVDAAGASYHDISEIVKSELYSEFEFPEVDANGWIKRDHINVSYFIRYAEKYGIPSTVKAMSTSQYFSALNGGVPFWKQVEYYTAGTSFWDRMQYDMNFLTWQPTTKKLSITGTEKLYWLAWKSTLNNTLCKLRFTLHTFDDNGITTSVVYSATQAVTYLDVFEMEVGYARLNTLYNFDAYFHDQGADGVSGQYYDVEVITDAGLVLSEKRTYQVDLTEYQNSREFLFLNSLGGYDTIRTTGIGEYEGTQERTFITSPYPKEFAAAFRMKKQVFVLGNDKMKVNSGWLTSSQVDWLQDMLLSEEVYEIKNSKLYPVVITSTSGPKKTDEQSPAYFVEFEYEYSSHESTFTIGTVVPVGGDFNEDYNPDFLID